MSIHSLFGRLAVLTIFISLSASELHAEDESLTQEVIQGLRKWRETISSLRIDYVYRNPNEVKAEHPDWSEVEVEGCYFVGRWIWKDDGSVYSRLSPYRNGKDVGNHMVEGANFRTNEIYQANFGVEEDGSQYLKSLSVKPMRSGSAITGNPMPLMRLWQSGRWFDDAIEAGQYVATNQPNTTLIQIKTLSTANPEVTLVDRQQQYLVQTIHHEAIGSKFSVEEYQSLENGTLFPNNGKYFAGNATPRDQVIEWEIVAIGINEQHDSGLFIPPETGQKTYIHDSTPARKYRRRDLPPSQVAAMADQIEMKDGPIRAIVPRGLQIQYMLLGLASICLVLGVWLARR
ncbi:MULTISPECIES: hypothetical protein [Pseudomonadati]|nr:hypothetical protein [Rosistilla oblonga]